MPPEQAATSSAPSFEGNPGAQGQGQPSFDANQLTEALQQQGGVIQQLQSDLANAKRGSKTTEETLNKIRSVFVPEQGQKDPFAALEQADREFLDNVLEQALEAEKHGGPGMPITVDLAARYAQQAKEIRELKKSLGELSNTSKALSNPNVQHDNALYMDFENQVHGYVKSLYGRDYAPAQEAITRHMADTLKVLQRDHPEKWHNLRINKSDQSKFTKWHVEQHIPPRARELLEKEQMANTEMTTEQLWQAFREAGKIEDAHMRSDTRARIRQAIWEQQYTGQRK